MAIENPIAPTQTASAKARTIGRLRAKAALIAATKINPMPSTANDHALVLK